MSKEIDEVMKEFEDKFVAKSHPTMDGTSSEYWKNCTIPKIKTFLAVAMKRAVEVYDKELNLKRIAEIIDHPTIENCRGRHLVERRKQLLADLGIPEKGDN
jgi:hypothetical protein